MIVTALAASYSHAASLTTLTSFILPGGNGTVFSIPLTGGTPTAVLSFNYTDGAVPVGSLTLGDLTYYGTTLQGGLDGRGTVFALTLPTPEPPSVDLIGLGAVGLGAIAVRRKMR